MKALFDTNILIDYLMGVDAAREILRGNGQLVPQVTQLLSFVEGQQEGRHGRSRELRRAA